MPDFQRFAVFYAPERGPFEHFAAQWLGWCPNDARSVAHPNIAGLPRPVSELTQTPRKYGFHGTLKPPFRLAPGATRAALEEDLAALAARLAPVEMPGLRLATLGQFLALVPEGDQTDLAALAGRVVSELDHHRAAPGDAELARRRASGLSARQEALLTRWGYPYVMDEFRFHLTLTGRMSEAEATATAAALEPHITPLLPRPFVVRELCLFGEADDGVLQLVHRYALTG